MKVYLIFQESTHSVIRLYKRKTDFLKFLNLYSDYDTSYLIIDTKDSSYPNIDQEEEQTWGVSFEEDSGKVIQFIRGVSFKPGIKIGVPWKGTTTIFVTALTKQEAIDKATEIYNKHGKDENTL
jgi:hypothetical protein